MTANDLAKMTKKQFEAAFKREMKKLGPLHQSSKPLSPGMQRCQGCGGHGGGCNDCGGNGVVIRREDDLL